MAAEWYFKIADREFGPVPAAQLALMASRGRIRPDDLLRKGPTGQWVEASRVNGLTFASPDAVGPQDASAASRQASHLCPASVTVPGNLEPLAPERQNQINGERSSGSQLRFWLWVDKAKTGPHSQTEILAMLQSRAIKASTPIQAEGSEEWLTLADFSEFAAAVASANAPAKGQTPAVSKPDRTFVAEVVHRSPTASKARGANPLTDLRSEWIHGPGLVQGRAVYVLLACIIVPFFVQSFGSPLDAGEPYLLAILSTVLGWFVFRAFCGLDQGRTERSIWFQSVGAFVFTAIVGMFALGVFLQIADAAAQRNSWSVGGHWVLNLAYTVVKFVGSNYHQLRLQMLGLAPRSFFPLQFLTMLASAGICEEILKLIPSLIALRILWGERTTLRQLVFLGAMSGLGFGVAEGLEYSFGMYKELRIPSGVYIMRFGSVALMHGVWTALASAILFRARNTALAEEPTGFAAVGAPLGFVALVALPTAICHSLYNCLPWLLGVPLNGLVVYALSRWPIADSEGISVESNAAATQAVAGKRTVPTWAWVIGGVVCCCLLTCSGLVVAVGMLGGGDDEEGNTRGAYGSTFPISWDEVDRAFGVGPEIKRYRTGGYRRLEYRPRGYSASDFLVIEAEGGLDLVFPGKTDSGLMTLAGVLLYFSFEGDERQQLTDGFANFMGAVMDLGDTTPSTIRVGRLAVRYSLTANPSGWTMISLRRGG